MLTAKSPFAFAYICEFRLILVPGLMYMLIVFESKHAAVSVLLVIALAGCAVKFVGQLTL